MPNQFVLDRLAGIQDILNGVHRASAPLSASTKGQERQDFIDNFLRNVLPSIYRFGSGDATDVAGNRSGQLDVVIEYPFSPTLPGFGSAETTRLYLAESLAAIVEVKSNASAQWDEALRTAAQLAPLRRSYWGTSVMGEEPSDQTPLFVAGYTGWKTIETIKEKLDESPDIAGVLVINPGIFVSSKRYGGLRARGAWSLWGLICVLHSITTGLQGAGSDPGEYAR